MAGEDVRKCRAELEKDADLTLYGTAQAAQDLEIVRALLGTRQFEAGSYGTRVALEYVRRSMRERICLLVPSGRSNVTWSLAWGKAG